MKFQAPRFVIVAYGPMNEYVACMTTTLDEQAAIRSAYAILRLTPSAASAEVHHFVEDRSPLEYRDTPVMVAGSSEPDLRQET